MVIVEGTQVDITYSWIVKIGKLCGGINISRITRSNGLLLSNRPLCPIIFNFTCFLNQIASHYQRAETILRIMVSINQFTLLTFAILENAAAVQN
jgi:hypothetical protein